MELKNAVNGMEVVATKDKPNRYYPPRGTRGVIKKVGTADLYVKWDYDFRETSSRDNTWYCYASDVEPLSEVKKKENKKMNKVVLGWARSTTEMANKDKTVDITFDGYKTTAIDTRTGRRETAYCMESDRDNFDVSIGIAIAYAKIKGYAIPKALCPTPKTVKAKITIELDAERDVVEGAADDIRHIVGTISNSKYRAEIE